MVLPMINVYFMLRFPCSLLRYLVNPLFNVQTEQCWTNIPYGTSSVLWPGTKVPNVFILKEDLVQVIGRTTSLNKTVQVMRWLEWDILPFLDLNDFYSHYHSLGLISTLDKALDSLGEVLLAASLILLAVKKATPAPLRGGDKYCSDLIAALMVNALSDRASDVVVAATIYS